MHLSEIYLYKKFSEKKVVKVIAGLNNFDINHIIKIAKAAEIGGATYIDITANPDIVKIIKSITNLPICVSSINPRDLEECVLEGADMVEIGNFDSFYDKKIIFSEYQIIKLAEEIKFLLNDISISVTIPHNLLLSQQIQLAIQLKKIGVNYIQTEGISTKQKFLFMDNHSIINSIHKASAALSSAYAISNSIDLPVIASSGIDSVSAPIAISYGASAVGIGSTISSLNTIDEMAKSVQEIVFSLSYNNKKIVNNRSLNMHSNKIVNTKIIIF